MFPVVIEIVTEKLIKSIKDLIKHTKKDICKASKSKNLGIVINVLINIIIDISNESKNISFEENVKYLMEILLLVLINKY